MSIKPVDFQVMIPKTSEVSKINKDELNKNDAHHQQQASTIQHEADNSLRQVHSQDKAQEGKIRDRQEKNKNARGEGNRDNGNKKEQKNKDKDKNSDKKTGTIDIRL